MTIFLILHFTANMWNVQSVVDTECPIEVAYQRCYAYDQRGEDRKMNLIMLELRRYNVSDI